LIYKDELIKFVNKTLHRKYSRAKNITAATQAALCQITAVAHGYSTGDNIFIQNVVGMTQLNNKYYVVTYVGVDTFTIGVNSTAYTAYTSGGTSIRDDLDGEIISALKDLSKRGNFLTEESTRKTILNRSYYSMPDHYKDKLLIMIDDYYPLGWETFKNYQYELSLNPDDIGYPEVFSKMDRFYYLRPTPDSANYTIRQFFACYHPEKIIIDSVEYKACDYILFNDIYRHALELRLIWEVAIGLSMSSIAAEYMTYYTRDEVPGLLANLDDDPVICDYPDE
jgi:hypothetical protein